MLLHRMASLLGSRALGALLDPFSKTIKETSAGTVPAGIFVATTIFGGGRYLICWARMSVRPV